MHMDDMHSMIARHLCSPSSEAGPGLLGGSLRVTQEAFLLLAQLTCDANRCRPTQSLPDATPKVPSPVTASKKSLSPRNDYA